jgi:inorganic triphosphatase YgiF
MEPVETFVKNKPTQRDDQESEMRVSGKRATGTRPSSGSGSHSGRVHQEIEWQYEAPHGLGRIEAWLAGRLPGGSAVTHDGFEDLTDTYYDTEDWHLRHAGYALRTRRETQSGKFEATVKSLAPGGGEAGNLRRWREISEPLESSEGEVFSALPGPVGERLGTLVGSCGLRPLFEVRTRRRNFGLVFGTDRIGEVVLDRSEIPLGAGVETVRLVRVEIEADASAVIVDPRLERFARTIEEALGLHPAATSKYDVGLAAIGQNQGDERAGEGLEEE